MTYDNVFFDQIVDRKGTACEKWDCLEARIGHPMNPMWVADMDFACPKEISMALAERAAHPIYGYTEQTDAAINAMLAYMQRRHGIPLQKDEQTLLPGVVTGLKAAVLTLTKEEDGIIIQPPVYGPFYASIRENNRRIMECPLLRDEGGRYTMNLASVEEACQNGAKLMLLCNPHNPVGRCWTKDELTALIQVLTRYHVPLVSDEIHEDFIMEGNTFTPILTLLKEKTDTVVAFTSVSKTFNLAGLQQAVLFTRNPEMMKAFQATLSRTGVMCGNIFALTATEAAYRYGDAWIDGAVRYIGEGEHLFRAELAKRLPKAILSPLEATYLGWIDLRAYSYSTEETMSRCRKAGVEFTPGTFFGKDCGEGFLRINYACPHARILEAAEQLEKAILSSY